MKRSTIPTGSKFVYQLIGCVNVNVKVNSLNTFPFVAFRLLSKCFPHLTDELMFDLKEKMNAATVIPNMRRADIAHKNYIEYQNSEQDSSKSSNGGAAGYEAEEADLSHYDVPEAQRLAAQQAETEDNLIPRRLWLYLLRRQGVEQLKWCQLSAQATLRLAEEVTKGVHRVEGRGLYRDEFVTCGGVNLKEVCMHWVFFIGCSTFQLFLSAMTTIAPFSHTNICNSSQLSHTHRCTSVQWRVECGRACTWPGKFWT